MSGKGCEVGWTGVELIRRYPGETKRAAVDRAYVGGVSVGVVDDALQYRVLPGTPADERVRLDDRRFMLGAISIVQRVVPDLRTVDERVEPRRRWPSMIVLAANDAPYVVQVEREVITLRPSWNADGSRPGGDEVWAAWWTTVKSLVELGCVAFEPDESAIIATSLSSSEARTRYRWV